MAAGRIMRATFQRQLRRTTALGCALLVCTAWAGTASYYYDELGRLVETVAVDGTSVFYAYDAVGNVTSLKHQSASSVGISGLVPDVGPIGATVTIFGSGFNLTAANNIVKFNGVVAHVASSTATTLIVTVPAGATTGTVSVTNGAATATSSLSFTVAASGAPTIASITPTIGAQSTPVTIAGTNFQPVGSSDKTLFGTIGSPVSSATASNISTRVPTQASSGKISVTTPYGTATSTSDFFAVPTGFNVADVQFTGRLAGGAPLTATTTVAGKIAIVLFDAIPGQTGTTLNLSNITTPGGNITIFNPAGGQAGVWPITLGVVGLPKLSMGGTYTAVVVPSAAGSATIQIGTVDLAIKVNSWGPPTANTDHTWSIPLSYTVTNIGTATANGTWNDVGYLSSNGVLDANSQSYYPLNTHSTLAAGASYSVNAVFTTTNSTAPGTYTFFAKTDGRNSAYFGGSSTNTDNGNLVEVSEANNIASTTVKLDADLKVSNVVLGSPTANQNGTWTIPVSYTVTNAGASTIANPSWYDMGYLSSNGVLDNSSQGSFYLNRQATPLAPGASYSINSTFTTNNVTPGGTYTFFVKADGHDDYTGGLNTDNGALPDANKANNVASVTVKLDADLKVSNVVLGSPTANSNGTWTIPVSYTVTNAGLSAIANPAWYDMGYLSSNGVLDNASQGNGYLNRQATPLAPGASYSINSGFTTNNLTPAGTYTFYVKADGHDDYTGGTSTDNGALPDANKANNVVSVAVKLDADLKVSNVVLGSPTANSNGTWSFAVSYTVTNTGLTTIANPVWYDMGYLSSNGVLDNASQGNGYLNRQATPLAPGASYSINSGFTTNNVTPAGTYTFFVKADGHDDYTGGTNADNGSLPDANKANNVASANVTLH